MGGKNCNHLKIYENYEHCYGITADNKNNTIRYNLFTGNTEVAIMHKGQTSALSYVEPLSTANKDYGDKIHHNIFLLPSNTPLYLRRDFTQVYNNIFDTGTPAAVIMNEISSGSEQAQFQTVYNNNFIDSGIIQHMGVSGTYCGLNYPISSWHPRFYAYNNILHGQHHNYYDFGDDVASIVVARGSTAGTLVTTDTEVTNNLFHSNNDPQGSYDILITREPNPVGYTGALYESNFDSAWNTTNFASDADGLWVGGGGANDYILYNKGSFSNGLEGLTAATAGRGGNHPYLPGVQIPSYIGAVNPNDNAWVDGVLGLATVSNLQNAPSGDPNWIEGANSDTTPPAAPTGLSVQ
jgi:hypothetical protein